MFQLSEDDLLPFLLNDNKTIITTVTNSGYLFYTLNMLNYLAFLLTFLFQYLDFEF